MVLMQFKMEVQLFFPTESSFPNFDGLIAIFPNSTAPTSERQENPYFSPIKQF